MVYGKVSIKKFKSLSEHEKAMLEIQAILDKSCGASDENVNKDVLAKVFAWHWKILTAFVKQKESVRHFVEVCRNYSIGLFELIITPNRFY